MYDNAVPELAPTAALHVMAIYDGDEEIMLYAPGKVVLYPLLSCNVTVKLLSVGDVLTATGNMSDATLGGLVMVAHIGPR